MKHIGIRARLAHYLPFFMLAPALLWQVLFLYIPLVIVLVLSFTRGWGLALPAIFTLKHYGAVFNSTHFIIIFRSLVLALFNAVACLLCAYPVAYFIAYRVKRFRNLLLFLLTIPFWTNFLVHVYAWFFLLEHNGLINTLLLKTGVIATPFHLINNMKAVGIVMVYCYFPFMIMPLYSVLEHIDKRLIESSFDLGATARQTFMRVTLPLSLPGIKTGFFLVFVPSFGEFAIPALVEGSKNMFVGTLISHYFLMARSPFLGAAFTFLSGAVLLVVVIILHRMLDRIGTYLSR